MNIIVVGTGFSGSIIARKIAEELNLNVYVIEKRNNIGGNMFDFIDENGILIQKYGPHFLNTNKYWIIKYLSQFSNLIPYDCSLKSYIDGKVMQLPFNFTTLKQLVGYEKSETLLSKIRTEFIGRDRVSMYELLDSKDSDISSFATLLYEKAFKTYTAKQWGVPIEKIDKSVINRVQFCVGYDSRYLNKDFQFLPEFGFTKLFENILNHPNIHLSLGVDAIKNIEFKNKDIYFNDKKVDLLVFTGAIDELFGYCYGQLGYRTLIFKYEYYNVDKYLPCEIMSYPQNEEFTRATEYKRFNFHCDNRKKTVVVREFPDQYNPFDLLRNVPCYPIITNDNMEIYKEYLSLSKQYKNLFLCGRLAEFKYYNMDSVIESTFEKFEAIKLLIKEKQL